MVVMCFAFANLILLAILSAPQDLDVPLPGWTELGAVTAENDDYLVVVETGQFTDPELADAKICDAIRSEVSRWVRDELNISGESFSAAMSSQQCESLIHMKRSHTSHFRAGDGAQDQYRGHAQICINKDFQSALEQSVHGSTLHKRLIWTLIVSILTLGSVLIAWSYFHGMRLTRGLYVRKLRWLATALGVVLLVCCFLVWRFVL